MNIIDLHCDTLLNFYQQKNYSLLKNSGHIDIEKLKKGGCLAQCFAIYIPSKELGSEFGSTDKNYKFFKLQYNTYQKEIKKYKNYILPALNTDDIINNAKDGKMSAVLTAEDGVFIEGKLERIKEAFDLGVRILALTWNYENCFGYPNSFNKTEHSRGLKPFGIEAVKIMNNLGIIIDVSHLSEGGFYDVAKYSNKPFIASHSCSDALYHHSRNLTDDQLKILGNAGGIVGINYYAEFIKKDKLYTSINDIILQAKHITNKAGIDAVAFGSDFDGMDSRLEFTDYSGYTDIVSALSKHFTDDEIEKICNKNALRVFKECIA